MSSKANVTAMRLDDESQALWTAYCEARGDPPAVVLRKLALDALVAGAPAPPTPAPCGCGLSERQVVFLGTLLSADLTAGEVEDLYAQVVDGKGDARGG